MFRFKKLDYLDHPKPQLPGKLIPFIWYFVRQMKEQFALIFLLYLTSAILLATVPLFLQWLAEGLEKVQSPETLWEHLFWPFTLFLIFILGLQPIVVQGGSFVQANTLPHFSNMVRRQLALYMHRHSYQYYQDDFAGRLAGKVVETPSAMNEIMHAVLNPFLYALTTFVVSVVLFSSVHWVFGLTSLVWLSVYFALLYYFVPKIQKLSKRASDERSHLRGRYVDILSNVLTVKLFARAQHEDSYLKESLFKTANGFVKVDLMLWRLWVSMEVLTTIMWGSIVFLSIWAYGQGILSIPQFVMIMPLTWQLSNTIWWLSDISTTFFQKLGEVQEGMDAIIKAQTVLDKPSAKALDFKRGHVRFDHVHFQYGEKTVFEDLNVDIPAGQKVGLIGPSGAGKSTFVQILLRLYDIQGGGISIDGQNIAEVTQDSLRQHIGVIPQMSDLLHRSLRDNIRYGQLEASDEQIIAAAKQAHAHEFVLELRDKFGRSGYDAHVGERGVKLSGGQRQRVAIARAILKNAPILILDEATSALDSESEKLIQDSLLALMEGKTVIAIAHRLSTIAHLDRLLVMDGGKIIEDGSHSDLLAKGGKYAQLWGMQSGGFLKD